MKDSIVSSIDRHVIDATALTGEQHQISRLQRCDFPRKRLAGTRLLT
jgi:hypothetical protein